MTRIDSAEGVLYSLPCLDSVAEIMGEPPPPSCQLPPSQLGGDDDTSD